MVKHSWRSTAVAIIVLGCTAVTGMPAAAAGPQPAGPSITGPLPGTPASPDPALGYPFFATPDDLAARGYVEQEFLISGRADGWDTAGVRVAEDIGYTTRVVVRRPARARHFNGTALVEWQNVTAGYDLDALWQADTVTRAGYAWVGVSAQRVGVDQLRDWNPARYGTLDVTGGGAYPADELSYDIFAQAGRALTASRELLGGLKVRTLLAVGASQSAARMTVYYDRVLPQVRPVFDGYGFIVGTAPARRGPEPVFQVLSETDVRSPARPPDTATFRRWEVAGSAHSGHAGQVYRQPIQERDLGAAPAYDCAQPPFSRVPLHHVVAASYFHLERWVRRGTPPPVAEPLLVDSDGTKQRDELGLARGGIRLAEVAVPTALNSGDNSGESFCRLFGTHVPFDRAVLQQLYPSRAAYLARVVRADLRNIRSGYLLPADAW